MSFTSERERSRWSDVYIAAFAQFFGALATFLVMVTLVLAMQRRGASGIEVSILVIAEALPMVLLGKFIGRLVDRVDSRRLLVIAGAGQLVAAFALAQAEQFGMVIAGAIALSVVSGIAHPTRAALVPAMVVRDDLPKASAIGQTAGSAGMMTGPALAGFLVGGLGVHGTLQLAAFGFAATIIAGLFLKTRRGGQPRTASAGGAAPAQREPALADTAPTGAGVAQGGQSNAAGHPTGGGMPARAVGLTKNEGAAGGAVKEWELRDDRLLWTSVWGFAAVLGAISAVNVVLVFFILGTLGSSEGVYGLVESMWTVGVLIGAWVFSRVIKPSTPDGSIAKWTFGTLAVISLALVLIGGVQHALWIVPCYLLGGMQNGGLNVLTGTLLGRRVPAAARGRASTATAMRVQAGALIGYIAGGLLLELMEPRWIVLGCGMLGIGIVAAVVPWVLRSVRDSELAVSHREPATVG
jgi:MFS family permease